MADWMTEEQKRALQEQYPKTLSGTGTNNTNNTDNIDWSAIGIPGQEQQTTPTAPTNTTPTSTTPASTTPNKGGTSVSDYIDYYTSRGITNPDKGYEQWVAWMQSGGDSTPSTTPAWTQPSTTPSTTPTSTQGTSVSDYIDYYTSRGITSPDKSYEQWAAWIASGGDTTPSTTPQTTPTTTPTETTPSSTTPTDTTPGSTQETPYDAQLAAWAAQTGADYNLLYYIKYGVYPNGSTTPGGNGTGVTGGNYQFTDLPSLPNYEQAIRDMYDAQINAERAALQEAGDQALSDAQANRDKIASMYQSQKNAASVDWERQRRNFLEGAMTSGLNTGAGSQAELSMMGMQQRSQNTLGAAQAGAEADADRNIADIKRSTQASINEAIMKNDYQKAAALLDEYKENYNRMMDRAEALASYGDFSGYAQIYGEDAAKNMRSTWIMSNPEIALAMGLITQQQYAALTLYKQYPALALTGGTGYSGGGGDYSGGSSSDANAAYAVIDAYLKDINNTNLDEYYKDFVDKALNN